MCQSSAYMENQGKIEMIMEDVDQFEIQNNQVRLVNIFGEEIKVSARIKKLGLVEHKIMLEPV